MVLNQHAKFFLDGNAVIFFVHKPSITHHNKSYGNEKFNRNLQMSLTMKTTTNTGKIQIFGGKVREKSFEAI